MHRIKPLFSHIILTSVCCGVVSEIPPQRYEIQNNGAEVSATSSASKCPLTSICQSLPALPTEKMFDLQFVHYQMLKHKWKH